MVKCSSSKSCFGLFCYLSNEKLSWCAYIYVVKVGMDNSQEDNFQLQYDCMGGSHLNQHKFIISYLKGRKINNESIL